MGLSDDLLHQAHHLARHEPRRPRQASLRRAISAAYYALFHLLSEEVTSLMLGGSPRRRRFRHALARGLTHTSMAAACKSFEAASLPRGLTETIGTLVVPVDLKEFARRFLKLQVERHQADYNAARVYHRGEVLELVQEAETAVVAWRRVRATDEACFFLASLSMWEQLRRNS